ncbi:hypothetical protein [Kistimonas asteriae]|uniref:hypothetical protein n=1 Tax=Kistimonas asteriae TaxID=517724 RepID=UPI001BA5CF01|nr:hypothetical protein [Kistimonas asteriae]
MFDTNASIEQLVTELMIMPLNVQPESDPDWSNIANCYSYACNDKHPSNGYFGGAIPGSTKGTPAFPGPDYHNRLITGAIADGMRYCSENDLTHLPNIIDGHYLVLLLADNNGFHWMRYDHFLNRWSWKSGNSGSVYYNVFNVSKNYCEYINMENLSRVLTSERKNYIWNTEMQFIAFFQVPLRGINVSSPRLKRKSMAMS